MKTNTIARAVSKFARKNAPKIFTVFGVAGVFITAIAAIDATTKANKLLEKKKEETNLEKIPPVEILKTVWKEYIPCAASAILSSACIIGSNSISSKRLASVAALIPIADNEIKKYREKVREIAGDEIEKKVTDELKKDILKSTPETKENVTYTGNGDTRYFEPISGRYFYSSRNAVEKAENILARRQLDDMWVTLNDFYDELGLRRVKTEIGDCYGWHIKDGMIEFIYDSMLDEEMKPCVLIDVSGVPQNEYLMR